MIVPINVWLLTCSGKLKEKKMLLYKRRKQEAAARKQKVTPKKSNLPQKRTRQAMAEDIIETRKRLMIEEHKWKAEEHELRKELSRAQINALNDTDQIRNNCK